MGCAYHAADILIGLDDTDNAESIGTGRLARMLAERLAAAGWRVTPGVTRHQHLVHPDIPYTSHNSSACVGLAGPPDRMEELWDVCRCFISDHEHPGADPGLCLAIAAELPDFAADYGRSTQTRIVSKDEAWDTARRCGVRLAELGGTGGGIIGALGAACLRAGGSDGRFLDLAGIRGLTGTVGVERILAETGIEAVADEQGRGVPYEELVLTNDWVRPQLRGGRPVLVVYPESEGLWACRRETHEP